MDGEGIDNAPDRRVPRLELVTPGSDSQHAAPRNEGDQVPPLSHALQLGAVLLGAGLAAVALAVGLSVDPLDATDVGRAIAQALAISVPVAAGLYALRRDPASRFARLLVVTGLAWAPTLLAMSERSVPYSIGRVWAWVVLVWVVYLLLAFPTGRLTTRTDRWMVSAALGLVAI